MGAAESACLWCALPEPARTATARVARTARATVDASCSPAVLATTSVPSGATYVGAPCAPDTTSSYALDIQCVTSAVWGAVVEEVTNAVVAAGNALGDGAAPVQVPFLSTLLTVPLGGGASSAADIRARARDALVRDCATGAGASATLSGDAGTLDASGLSCEEFKFLAQRTGARALCGVAGLQGTLGALGSISNPAVAAVLPPVAAPPPPSIHPTSFLAIALYALIVALLGCAVIGVVYHRRAAPIIAAHATARYSPFG